MTAEPLVTLICTGTEQTVPRGVLASSVQLPSVYLSPEIQDWISIHHDAAVFVMPGAQTSSAGAPALVVPVTEEEYMEVVAASG